MRGAGGLRGGGHSQCEGKGRSCQRQEGGKDGRGVLPRALEPKEGGGGRRGKEGDAGNRNLPVGFGGLGEVMGGGRAPACMFELRLARLVSTYS